MINKNSAFPMTFTQVKQVYENLGNCGYKGDFHSFMYDLTDQPEYIKFMGEIEAISELQAIIQGGCESGAYMPAVTYQTAIECMGKHGTQVLEDLAEFDGIPIIKPSDSWGTYCSTLCSAAVELWCHSFSGVLQDVNWD